MKLNSNSSRNTDQSWSSWAQFGDYCGDVIWSCSCSLLNFICKCRALTDILSTVIETYCHLQADQHCCLRYYIWAWRHHQKLYRTLISWDFIFCFRGCNSFRENYACTNEQPSNQFVGVVVRHIRVRILRNTVGVVVWRTSDRAN